jgi:Yip1 domain
MSDPNQPFQPPPPPPFAETPSTPAETMPTSATLTGIFFEPGRVFEALRERPRFLAAGLILLMLTIVVTVVLFLRVDMGQFIRDQMDKSPRNAQMSEQEKEMGVKFGKIIGAVAVPASVPITIAAGAALYMLGVMAFGGSITYKQSLSVWAYSSLPPTVLGTIVAIMVLFLKSSDQVNPERLLVTNPGAFMGPDTSAVLTAVLAQFDLLRFYGLFLAALGLRKVARMSSGAAWGVVITLWLLGAIIKVASAAIFGG